MAWTVERVNLLRNLWSAGLSASKIALELGDVSRNAVLGKVDRLGLAMRRRRSMSKRAVMAADGTMAFAGPTSMRHHRPPAPLKVAPEKKQRKAYRRTKKMPLSFSDLTSEQQAKAVPSVYALKANHCRWPYGNPGDADFCFCGEEPEVGKPYCSGHCEVAFKERVPSI